MLRPYHKVIACHRSGSLLILKNTQSLRQKRTKDYPSPHMHAHRWTAQCHGRQVWKAS